MLKVKPKKNLGQHFLTDQSIALQIADTLDGFAPLPLLEVGPGTGVLTQYLLQKDRPMKAVELDSRSVQYLRQRFAEAGESIIEADFLRLDLKTLFEGQFCIIGNFPYNISSQIFFKILECRNLIPAASGMLQREVAQRIASNPGRKAYGILSVLLQAWYNVEYLFEVEPQAFNPPPKVQSAVIRIVRNDRETLSCNEGLFRKVVKTAFNQRRKTLRNSLSPLIGKPEILNRAGLFDMRPEQLSVAEFEELTNIVNQHTEAVS
jgi:16S rRNA (adenine1518-N6/adenine1519-N6)-dimethyltransferase